MFFEFLRGLSSDAGDAGCDDGPCQGATVVYFSRDDPIGCALFGYALLVDDCLDIQGMIDDGVITDG